MNEELSSQTEVV